MQIPNTGFRIEGVFIFSFFAQLFSDSYLNFSGKDRLIVLIVFPQQFGYVQAVWTFRHASAAMNALGNFLHILLPFFTEPRR